MYPTSTHIAPSKGSKKGSLSGNYKYTALALEIRKQLWRSTGIRSCYLLCKRKGTEIGKMGVISILSTKTEQQEQNGHQHHHRLQSQHRSQKVRNCLKVQQKVPLRQKQRLKVQMRKRMHCKLQILPKAEHYLPQMQKLCAVAAGYASAFSGQNFQKAYDMKADVESAVLDLYTEDVYGNADEGRLFNVCRTDGPGIVVYSVDGFEDVKAEDVTTDMFSMKAYHKENLRLNGTIKSGDPLYKTGDRGITGL